ncbi:uncharacterized protein LOC117118494 [Anneissia japonica]|uniref:uncharacterized protein LOC117118494 n=1 Tax=Anneissia japonica TaxID=1529436 RepID=UPI00142555B3|nr:uncharacterized protein LOC117118494 [Anneissia japonica]
MLQPSSSLVYNERPTKYLNGVRKKDHHLKPIVPVVASDAVSSERPRRPKASKPYCSASSTKVSYRVGARKTRSAGPDQRRSDLKSEKRALSGSSNSTRNRSTQRSIPKDVSLKNGNGDTSFISVDDDDNYSSEEETSADVLLIDTQSATNLSHPGSAMHGKISPRELLVQCQESNYEQVYDINLHASSIKKIHNLEKFRKLKILDLSCNAIECIENLSCNTNLKELKLYGNQITEIKNLEKLTELCSLQLQFNRLKSIEKGLLFAKKLKCLRIDNNQLTKLDAREIAPCSQLTNLDVSCNKLDNLSFLNCLNSLEELFGSHNRLRTVTDLSRCRKLQEVNLSSNNLTDISGLKGLPLLKTLHLSRNLLTSEAMQALGKLRSLQELDLSHNRITKLASFPSQFPAIEILSLTRNSIEWLELIHLASCELLVELFVAENPFIQTIESKQSLHECREIFSPQGVMRQFVKCLCYVKVRYKTAITTVYYYKHLKKTQFISCFFILSYHHEVHASIPSLEMVDGVTVKHTRHNVVPFMRPMSAASGLSAKQVQSQLQTVEADLNIFGQNLRERFENLRTTMDTLPSERPRSSSVASDLTIRSVSSFTDSRPSSRCNSRSRIKDAKAYATTHFK